MYVYPFAWSFICTKLLWSRQRWISFFFICLIQFVVCRSVFYFSQHFRLSVLFLLGSNYCIKTRIKKVLCTEKISVMYTIVELSSVLLSGIWQEVHTTIITSFRYMAELSTFLKLSVDITLSFFFFFFTYITDWRFRKKNKSLWTLCLFLHILVHCNNNDAANHLKCEAPKKKLFYRKYLADLIKII